MKNGKDEIQAKIRLYTVSSILMLKKKKKKYMREKVLLKLISSCSFLCQMDLTSVEKNFYYIYLCIKAHDTGCSFELIFMKFAWLMWIYPWVNLIAFGNNRPNITTEMVKVCPQNRLFNFHSTGMGFFEEKILLLLKRLLNNKIFSI